jgi:hypothetical protein
MARRYVAAASAVLKLFHRHFVEVFYSDLEQE